MKADIICWDSSVIISHIGGGKEQESKRKQAIQSVVRLVELKKYKLVVSTILYPEVLATAMPVSAINLFENFMQKKEVIGTVAVNTKVARKAQEIRNSIKIKTPDAIHIATAIVSKAKCFHTFDDDLIKLSGLDEVESLGITRCVIYGTNASF